MVRQSPRLNPGATTAQAEQENNEKLDKTETELKLEQDDKMEKDKPQETFPNLTIDNGISSMCKTYDDKWVFLGDKKGSIYQMKWFLIQ